MKKNECKNTYFNREIGGYIGMLLRADALLETLETAAQNGIGGAAVEASRRLDTLIIDIMEKRATVEAILSADMAFRLS